MMEPVAVEIIPANIVVVPIVHKECTQTQYKDLICICLIIFAVISIGLYIMTRF